jgi:AraC-like DNA-binding protein
MDLDDYRVEQARSHHLEATGLSERASRFRRLRDELVGVLRESDPERWTMGALAREVGCSKELIAYILRERARRQGVTASSSGRPGSRPRPAACS